MSGEEKGHRLFVSSKWTVFSAGFDFLRCVCVKVRNFRSHFTSLVPYIHWLSKMIFYMIGIRRLSSLPKVVVVCVTVSV